MDRFRQQLDAWPPGPRGRRRRPASRAVLSAAAIADYTQDPLEGQHRPAPRSTASAATSTTADLQAGCSPTSSSTPTTAPVRTAAPELGLPGPVAEADVRERVTVYAQKLLGRLTGKLPDVAPPTP